MQKNEFFVNQDSALTFRALGKEFLLSFIIHFSIFISPGQPRQNKEDI
jgi:hypothetical protein